MANISVSPSRFGTLSECPFKFLLEYIKKIKKDKDGKDLPEGDALKFGSFIHKMLQVYVNHLVNTKQKRDAQFINDNFDWQWERFKVEDEDRKYLAREMLAYFLAQDIESDKVVDVEILQGFPLEAVPQAKIWFRLDRVDAPDEKSIIVIDYKSGRKMPTLEELKDDLAFTVYSWGMRKMYPMKENYTMRWMYLEQSKPLELPAMGLEEAEAKIIPVAKKLVEITTKGYSIEKMGPEMDVDAFVLENFPKVRNKYCKWCSFLKAGYCDMNLHSRIPISG